MAFARLALIVAIASACVWMLWGVDFDAGRIDLRSAVGVIASVDATLVGFLVSAGALLYAVANTRLIRNLQRTGHFGRLVHNLCVDAGAFLVALIISLVCLFLPAAPAIAIGSVTLTKLQFASYFLVFTNAVAFQLLLPVGWTMWLVLTNIEPDNPGTIESDQD